MRSRLIDVALRLFARRGVDGVSIAEIAVVAGASKANVMHHFGSKDGLYAACLDVIDAHLHAAVDTVVETGDLPSALEGWAAEHPDDVRVMAYGLLRLPERDGRWALSSPVTRERVRSSSERMQRLLGYSIHPPFMGFVHGMHPERPLEGAEG